MRTHHYSQAADAMAHVAGFTVAHDVSARDWQLERNGGQWLVGKVRDVGVCCVVHMLFCSWLCVFQLAWWRLAIPVVPVTNRSCVRACVRVRACACVCVRVVDRRLTRLHPLGPPLSPRTRSETRTRSVHLTFCLFLAIAWLRN